MDAVYLDNAATSWPKAPGVAQAVAEFLDHVGASPGRSGHRMSIEAGRIVYSAREALAELFGAPDPLRIVFCMNATEALNIVLHGLLRPGDHVVTTSVDHNAMMRPLRTLERAGVQLTVVPCAKDGRLDPRQVEAAMRRETALVAMTHASNVVGTLLPIAEIGRIARRRKVPFLVDAAATAGAVPISMAGDGIDLLAFTGHKALLGPTGTGGLVIGSDFDVRRLRPLMQGGTGSHSEHEEQPDVLPDMLESGTLNSAGIAGLERSVRWILGFGVERIRGTARAHAQALIEGLQAIEGVTVYGTRRAQEQTAVVTFNIERLAPSDVGLRLDREHGILCRVGLHCAPAAHRTIGTFPAGAVRFAPGVFTTEGEIRRAVTAVEDLAIGKR
jgi:cysteine desulfurase/selenocysteine lyase